MNRFMKKTVSAAIAVLMVLAGTLTAEGTDNTKSQKNAQYSTIGESEDFRTFTRTDDKYTTTYYDIYDGKTSGRDDVSDLLTLMEQTIYHSNIIGRDCTPAEYWASFAVGVFASNHESYYSFNNKPFKTRFMNSVKKGGKGYGKLKEGLSSYSESKASTKNTKAYRDCDVNTIVSGKRTAANLSQVQKAAYDLLTEVNPGKNRAKDYENNSSLKGMADDTDTGNVIYNLFATRDRQGSTYRYIYNCFGIAYSDFSISPVTAEYDETKGNSTGASTALKDYNTLDEALAAVSAGTDISGFKPTSKDTGKVSSFKNESTESVEQEISMTKSKEETLSSSISHGNQTSFSSTQSVNFSFGTDEAFFKAQAGLSFTESELWTKEVNETDSTSNSESTTTTQKVTLPGHTGVVQNVFESDYVYTMAYDCPVEISYTVTIFSYNGCYYDDNVKTKYFNSKGYSQTGFMTQFENANTNLRERKSRDTGYDEANGVTRGIKVKHGYSSSTYTWDHPWVSHLNYSSIKSAMNETGVKPGYDETVGALSDCRAISVTGGELKRTGKGSQGSVGSILPLYTLNKVKLRSAADSEKSLAEGKTLNLSMIEMNGIDEMDGAFYGFTEDKGKWQLIDDEGNTIEKSDVISLTENANGDYIVKGLAPGTANVKYKVRKEAYKLYTEEAGATRYVKPSDVKKTPQITITVTKDDGTDSETSAGTVDDAVSPDSGTLQISEEEETAFVNMLDCEPGQCSIAQAVLFAKNDIGADSDLNERIYASMLMQLASGRTDSNSIQDEYEAEALVWGMKHGLFDEMDRELLASQSGITELEFAEITYRLAEMTGESAAYTDISEEYSGFENLSDFEKAAMNRAAGRGLLSEEEKSAGMIMPDRVITAEEAAAFFTDNRSTVQNN